MNGGPSPPVETLQFADEGDDARRAVARLQRHGPRLETALRRAVPFLSRRGTPIKLDYSPQVTAADMIRDLPPPLHWTHLVTAPNACAGALVLDAGAIGMFLDGVLGGDGGAPAALAPAGLTAPLSALIARTTDGIVTSFSSVLAEHAGVQLEARTTNGEGTARIPMAACTLECGNDSRIGRVVLLLATEALVTRDSAEVPHTGRFNPAVAATLEHVELEMVAELGRVRMKLGDIANLRVGDTLRLDVAVGDAIAIRADGHLLLRGRPTASAGRLAVQIQSRHDR
jgi:flagellar motor switch protein FliM